MKRLIVHAIQAAFLAAWCSLAALPVLAQNIIGSGVWGDVKVSGGLDPATTAWVAQVVTNGGTVSSPRQTIVNSFIVCLKTNSLFSLLDRYWLLAGENTQSALTDMVGLSLATNHGLTFTASVGYDNFAAGTVWIDMNYNPSTNATHFTQNSGASGIQIQNNRTTPINNTFDFGADNSGSFTQVIQFEANANGGNIFASMSSNGNSDSSPATTSQGSWLVSRTGASAGEVYRNGTGNFAITSTTTGLPTTNVYVSALDFGGANFWAPDQYSSFYIGGGLSGAQAANFETCQNAMMTSIGINVH